MVRLALPSKELALEPGVIRDESAATTAAICGKALRAHASIAERGGNSGGGRKE
jgi:hypothetical protein